RSKRRSGQGARLPRSSRRASGRARCRAERRGALEAGTQGRRETGRHGGGRTYSCASSDAGQSAGRATCWVCALVPRPGGVGSGQLLTRRSGSRTLAERRMSGPAVDRVSPWSKAVMQRLFDWECRCAAAEEVHFDVAEELSRRNLFLGIPVVVLSAIVGTSLFASVSGDGVAVWIRIAAGTVSLIAGVLASIQTFLRFGARAEQHRVAAERWAAVKREIEKVRTLPSEQVGEANELLDDIKARMDQAADKSPAMPKRRWSRALAKQERAAKHERTRRKGRTV